LTVASDKLVEHVTLVELDEEVAAVWQTILNGGNRWLAEKVSSYRISHASVNRLLSEPPKNIREMAFQTLVRNRVSHGGIIAPGAGVLQEGEDGKGISSRWYQATLSRRIRQIHRIRERLTFIFANGLSIIDELGDNPSYAWFIDPPYTAGGSNAGTRLYKLSDIDHEWLFKSVASISGDFLMTYDDTEEVRALVRWHHFKFRRVQMRNTHHDQKYELLIGRNLDWFPR
jgi:DNA adenine methylase